MDFINLASSKTYENGWELLESVCEMFYKDQGFYRSALRTEGQNSFREYLLESMRPIVEFLFEDTLGDMSAYEVINKMFCQVYIMAVSNWMEDGCKTEPSAFVGAIKELIRKLAESL